MGNEIPSTIDERDDSQDEWLEKDRRLFSRNLEKEQWEYDTHSEKRDDLDSDLEVENEREYDKKKADTQAHDEVHACHIEEYIIFPICDEHIPEKEYETEYKGIEAYLEARLNIREESEKENIKRTVDEKEGKRDRIFGREGF